MRSRRRDDRTLVDVAVRELREAILRNELEPGSQLILADLAERLSMSVMPVREAIKWLQTEGLVEQVPHRGARVSPISIADLEDLYSVRIPLEALATRRTAERFSEDDYERLSAVLADYVEAHARGDEARGREMHATFHLGLYEVAGSRWLMRVIGPTWEAAERYQRLSGYLRSSIEERYGEHERILEHCRFRDPEGAGDALREHLLKSMNLIKAELRESIAERSKHEDR